MPHPILKRPKLLVALVVCVLAYWVVFRATWPAQKTRQLTVTRPDGTPVAFTVWEAAPVVPLPFYDGPTYTVRFLHSKWKPRARALERGLGQPLVAPDRSKVILCSTFASGSFPRVMVDLTTGTVSPADYFGEYEKQGWTPRPWHTQFEALPLAEILEEMKKSRDDDRTRELLAEWGTRPEDPTMWPLLLQLAKDPGLGEWKRGLIEYMICYDSHAKYEAELACIARELDNADPEIRLFAAWVLSDRDLDRDGPSFDLIKVVAQGPSAMEEAVAKERAWWREQGSQRKPTARPH